jgi:molybdopterin biosynthesis enzyme
VRPEIFDDVLAFDRALALVLESAAPVDRIETVALADADGRVAARHVNAPMDVPRFDRAAMDGYAVVADDTAGATPEAPVRLHLVGGLFTGQVPARGIGPGECLAIATGAPIPPGATAVVMVEETAAVDTTVLVRAAVRTGQNIGRRGADVPAGHTVVSVGDLLTPGRIGAIAAVGAAEVAVFAKPIVSVLSTGNEVVPPGQPLGPTTRPT